MDSEDEQHLNEIGDEIAVPQQLRSPLRDDPHDRNDRQREGKGYEQRHAVVAIKPLPSVISSS